MSRLRVDSLDDLPIFRPRMRGGRGGTPRGGSARLRNALLSCVPRGARRRGPRLQVTGLGVGARRVVVKAHVARLGGRGARAAVLHLRYIERDGVEKDGSKGVLYGADGSVLAEAFEKPRAGEKHQFRIIVSPEDAGELDLTIYVRRLMAQVEQDLGRKVEWAAVNHYNTEHPHAHLVIRGVDREGRELRLERSYISNGLRSRGQEIATEELGPRLDFDVRRAREREVTQERFTSLDRELERRAVADRVQARTPRPTGRLDESLLIARLQHLESLRLAERMGPASWTLSPGWQKDLRELGTRGDILKQIHMAARGDRARYRIVRVGQPIDVDRADEPLVHVGRVASKGLSDELKGAFYVVLETPTGHAYHVPINARTAEELRPGDIVTFASRREPAVRAVDREIAQAAASRGGSYAPEPAPDGAPHPHARRLLQLEREGLAIPEAAERWRIAPNLLQELEARHQRAPARYELLVRKEPSLEQQVRHPGPTVLDMLKADPLSPTRFGADVKRALEEREAVLARLGIRFDGPHRSDEVLEPARSAAGEAFAARTKQTFVRDVPDRFRGRVQLEEARFPDYAFVSDGLRFVVLRISPELRAAQGKHVGLTRDAQGRVVVSPERDRDLGR
jgi:type IV secretory pathway VirD2 relaxase